MARPLGTFVKYTAAKFETAVAAYTGGSTLRQAAAMLDITWQGFRGMLKARGIPVRGRAEARKISKAFPRRRINGSGYVTVRIDGERRLEHRVVMERAIGRPLGEDEVVHHVNHDRADNSLENLRILSPGLHSQEHAIERWSDPSWKAQVVDKWKAGGNVGMFKPGHNT